MKLVSVIVPYFNNESTVLRALDSIKCQTYSNIEIILINDGSSDKTKDVVNKYILDNNKMNFKHIILPENKGPSVARNIGINQSNGELIAFLDADDSWVNNKIELQAKVMDNNPELVLIACDHFIEYNNEKYTKSRSDFKIIEVTFKEKLIKNRFCTPSVMLRRRCILDYNLKFNENQKFAEDTLFYLQILRRFKSVKIQAPLVTLYKPEISSVGLSSKILETEKWELRNFKTLYKENKFIKNNKISLIKLNLLYLFSFIKFTRRVVKYSLKMR